LSFWAKHPETKAAETNPMFVSSRTVLNSLRVFVEQKLTSPFRIGSG
jgi:hypothetical protein